MAPPAWWAWGVGLLSKNTWWLMAPWMRIPVNKVEAVWCFMALPDFHSTILIEAVIGFKERGTKTLPLSGKSAAMPSNYHQGE